MKLRVLGISGGNGVLLYPFKKYLLANIEIRSAFQTENDKQWKLNFGKIPLIKDKEFKEYGFPDFGKVDVIVGHPNCGAGSVLRLAKSKSFSTSVGDTSVNLFFNAVSHYRPKFFLLENLEAFFKSFPKEDLQGIFASYNLVFHTGPVARWGNSQIGRKRLIIVGIRRDQKINSRAFKLPKQENIHLSNCKELEELLATQLIDYNEEQLFHIREDDSTVMHMEKDFKRLNLSQIRKEWNKPENQSKKSWNAETHGKGRMKTLPGVYRNRNKDYPRAVLRNNRQFDPNGNIMSPRQLANIQGIPTEFKLFYKEDRKVYCLNKARVTIAKSPPHEIGLWFFRRLRKIFKTK